MKKAPSQEEIMEQVQRLLEERGRKALEMARKTVLEEEIECKAAREALRYFMTEYWHDVARPALLSLTCEAVGGDPEITTPIAIPMTLISGAIDIHDDIIDESKSKGSRPTVLGKFGKDIALLVGDALLFKGFALLYKAFEKKIPAEKAVAVVETIRNTFFELGDAEALELQFRGRMDITPEQYLRVVRKKAADVQAHTRISAILGGGSKEEIEALSKYGRFLGMLIILRDDLIDMIDMRETRHRIRKECLPLPLLYALQDSKAKLDIGPILQRKKLTKSIVGKLLKITYEAQGFDLSMKIMKELADKASVQRHTIENRSTNLQFLIRCMVSPVI
jgi:geranylgeranyl pyrophosphate synthase